MFMRPMPSKPVPRCPKCEQPARPHCQSPSCPWWRCHGCKVQGGRLVKGIYRWTNNKENA